MEAYGCVFNIKDRPTSDSGCRAQLKTIAI